MQLKIIKLGRFRIGIGILILDYVEGSSHVEQLKLGLGKPFPRVTLNCQGSWKNSSQNSVAKKG